MFSVNARLAEPINPKKMADTINGRTVDLGTVKFHGISLPKRNFIHSPYANQRFPYKRAATDRLDRNLLTFPLQNKNTLPRQNFRAKRAFSQQPTVSQTTIIPQKAQIPDRQIQATTPAGKEELKKQLNTIQ